MLSARDRRRDAVTRLRRRQFAYRSHSADDSPTVRFNAAAPGAGADDRASGRHLTGTFEVQIDAVRRFNTMTLTLEQNDRSVRGTWRTASGIRTPETNPWHGEISGTMVVENGETQFAGSTSVVADTASGVGACNATVGMNGTLSSASLRWTGPNLVSTSCRSNAGGFVWILGR